VLSERRVHVPKNGVQYVQLPAKMFFKTIILRKAFILLCTYPTSFDRKWYFWRVNMSPHRLPTMQVCFFVGISSIYRCTAFVEATRLMSIMATITGHKRIVWLILHTVSYPQQFFEAGCLDVVTCTLRFKSDTVHDVRRQWPHIFDPGLGIVKINRMNLRTSIASRTPLDLSSNRFIAIEYALTSIAHFRKMQMRLFRMESVSMDQNGVACCHFFICLSIRPISFSDFLR
jgi:hypothetical protein